MLLCCDLLLSLELRVLDRSLSHTHYRTLSLDVREPRAPFGSLT